MSRPELGLERGSGVRDRRRSRPESRVDRGRGGSTGRAGSPRARRPATGDRLARRPGRRAPRPSSSGRDHRRPGGSGGLARDGPRAAPAAPAARPGDVPPVRRGVRGAVRRRRDRADRSPRTARARRRGRRGSTAELRGRVVVGSSGRRRRPEPTDRRDPRPVGLVDRSAARPDDLLSPGSPATPGSGVSAWCMVPPCSRGSRTLGVVCGLPDPPSRTSRGGSRTSRRDRSGSPTTSRSPRCPGLAR